MIRTDYNKIAVNRVAYDENYKRMVFKGSVIGGSFLFVFSLIDLFYAELYRDSIIEAIACIILYTLAYIEKKHKLKPWGIIAGIIVIAIVIGNGAFSNEAVVGAIIWLPLVPFISFFLLGEKLGLKVSIFISTIYILIMVYIVNQFPGTGYNIYAVLSVIGALCCSIILSFAYERNRISMIHLLAEQANTDPLTSLLNRRGLIASFASYVALAKRNKQNLCLVLMDLDRFKAVNDKYGHDAGDVVLQRSASIAKDLIRSIDSIARIGGEEFIIILPNTSPAEALVITERIRLAIEKLVIKSAEDESIKITVSMGITSSSKNTMSFEGLLKIADKALYAAKNQGRNCIVLKEQDLTVKLKESA